MCLFSNVGDPTSMIRDDAIKLSILFHFPLNLSALSYMYTVFDLIRARGAYVKLFSTTSAKR